MAYLKNEYMLLDGNDNSNNLGNDDVEKERKQSQS